MLTAMHHHEFKAMNCTIGFWVAGGGAADAQAAFATAEQAVHAAEHTLSRFLAHSELSRLNAAAGHCAMPVSPLLWDVLSAALTAAESTGGLFDPTVLPALRAAGYDRSFDDLAGHRLELRAEAGQHRPRWREIEMRAASRSIRLPAGAAIDLGGIAKGWLADRLADQLAACGPCLVDMGGDIALRGRPPGEPGWPGGVANPLHPDDDLVTLALSDAGVATSGRDFRTWIAGGTPQHHLIDPVTQRPAITDVLTATVVAQRAAVAEVLATVALLQGAVAGIAWLGSRPAEGLLVLEDATLAMTPRFSDLTWCERGVPA